MQGTPLAGLWGLAHEMWGLQVRNILRHVHIPLRAPYFISTRTKMQFPRWIQTGRGKCERDTWQSFIWRRLYIYIGIFYFHTFLARFTPFCRSDFKHNKFECVFLSAQLLLRAGS